jgi:hypothetical protein
LRAGDKLLTITVVSAFQSAKSKDCQRSANNNNNNAWQKKENKPEPTAAMNDERKKQGRKKKCKRAGAILQNSSEKENKDGRRKRRRTDEAESGVRSRSSVLSFAGFNVRVGLSNNKNVPVCVSFSLFLIFPAPNP